VDGGAPPSSTTVTYFVTRLWSNQAAAANNADPCVPAPANVPYFNVAVDPPEIDLTSSSDSQTFEALIEPFAYGDVGQIKWRLADQPGPGITVSPSQGVNSPGQTIRMTITVDPSAQSSVYPLYMIVHSTKLGGFNQWVGNIILQ
jgi:hypothetical protein